MTKAGSRAGYTYGLPFAPQTIAEGAVLIPREVAITVIEQGHYSHSYPSGWQRCYRYGTAYVVFSISANPYLEKYLYGSDIGLKELARLWAPDGHSKTLLSSAVSAACKALYRDTGSGAVVSFADPNQGHHGGVYQACSWHYTGVSADPRVYRLPDGTPVARRSFHSGNGAGASWTPDLPMERLLPKHRYTHPLNGKMRRLWASRVAAGLVQELPYPRRPDAP